MGYILDKFSLFKLYTSVSKLHYTITYMMITAPHYFSKCPPLAAMHFTALAFMSNIALLTITGPICATSFVMLACSSLKLEWRGLYTLDSRYSQRQKHLITFHKIPLTSQVSLFQSIHFMKMADVGFVFTTVFLVSYGFVKTVLLDFSPSTAIFAKAKFGKRKFFLRHPVDV